MSRFGVTTPPPRRDEDRPENPTPWVRCSHCFKAYDSESEIHRAEHFGGRCVRRSDTEDGTP